MPTDDDQDFPYSELTKVGVHLTDGIRARTDASGFILERKKPDNSWEAFTSSFLFV